MASVVDVDVVGIVDVVVGRVVVDDMTGSVVGMTGGGMFTSTDASSWPLPRPRPLQLSYLGFLLLPPLTKKLMM